MIKILSKILIRQKPVPAIKYYDTIIFYFVILVYFTQNKFPLYGKFE